MSKRYKLFLGDCLEVMKKIPDKKVDCIICDLPYGTSASSWDKVINSEKLWEEYKRIIKENKAIVLFSQQPFTTCLIYSNMSWWKYNWIWEKDNATNFLNSHYCPMKITEDICVFGTGAISPVKNGKNLIYNPQFGEGKPYKCKTGKHSHTDSAVVAGGVKGRTAVEGYETISDGKRYPKNLIKFNRDKDKLHPTQKPVALLEYLAKTYTLENEIVLDNCMGSGSTGIACINTNRKFIGIEKEEKYFNIAKERIEKAEKEYNERT